jgi:DNA-binding NtrC family response regulator
LTAAGGDVLRPPTRECGVLVNFKAEAERLLLLHPDAAVQGMLAEAVRPLGYTVTAASSFGHAAAALDGGAIALALISTEAAGPRGIASEEAEFISALRAVLPQLRSAEVLILTQRSLSLDACCELVQAGVSGFIDAREGLPSREALLERLEAAARRRREVRALASVHQPQTPAEANTLVWRSPIMGELLQQAARAAVVSDVPVLIYGESGTGKQLLAELIHRLDPKRSSRRFLSLNCSAIAGTLAESALFGHVKGAFTGAVGPRKGVFRAAEGGTVLLDEISEMEQSLQPKLLRVLQESVVMPVGADDEVPIDVRVIAATNRRLAALVEEGKFRLDLYQRLNVIILEIPPLRERPEDIPALVQFFVRKYASYCAVAIEDVEPEVYEFLRNCSLQGNVRELENAVRQMLAFKTTGRTLTLADVPPALRDRERSLRRANAQREQTVLTELVNAACRLVDAGNMTLPQLVSTCEKLVLRHTLRTSKATSSDLARQLGLSRRTLYNKIAKYRLTDLSQGE